MPVPRAVCHRFLAMLDKTFGSHAHYASFASDKQVGRSQVRYQPHFLVASVFDTGPADSSIKKLS